ncbi:ferrous iron transporter B [Flavonifractor sp. An4]|uniref:ferrous iron transporter B n=1 Tax=Flavonifractor sp. An4 TaxID=1965634 RepID=UPI000B3A1C8D|nr:ferrous iron transporter B [Flavonifractor sp. An4]OUO13798.1 ferrous iron transporter B [Flavonifractor sp. An4]
MELKIALAGNPNCGKTTLFNALTGSSQYVGNWPGVTVEKKEGKLKGHKDVVIQDLPGIYSLSPYTLEEVVARNYLVNEKPDAILNIVDGTNIERNLYLTTQLIELGIPVVVAVNMIDLVRKNGDVIDLQKLGSALGCQVVEMSALKGEGGKEAAERAVVLAKTKKAGELPHVFTGSVEHAIAHIEESIAGLVEERYLRWYAIKVFERDEKVLETLNLTGELKEHLEAHIADCEAELDDDAESIITNQRYSYISSVVGKAVKKKKAAHSMSTSDKIDRIVTNRILALPIFVAVMILVYSIAMGGSAFAIGTRATDWANDGLFGDGWFVPFTADTEAWEEDSGAWEEASTMIEGYEAGESEVYFYDDETGETTVVPVTEEAYQAALQVSEPDPNDYGTWVPGIPVLAEGALTAVNAHPVLQSLILDGIIGGVGAVLGFVPQMLVLFLLLALLEDCGYMARIAFIMDRIFRRFGLSGKSFIPMLVATGCGVPGIMASRTIEQERDRRMTIMTTGFIPCGAKMPIIALFAGALFGGSAWVATSAYFIGVAAVVISGIILKKTKGFAGDPAPFVMELPAYHAPAAGNVLRAMWERGWSFIKRAGTVILLSSIILWFLQGFGFVDGVFQMVEDNNDSLLAAVGHAVSFIFAPLGFGFWEATVAVVTGLIAKEEVVSTFGVLFPGNLTVDMAAAFTAISAYSFMIFNLLCAPCFAAMGAIKREMNSPKWTLAAIGYMCGFAYVISLIVYQIGGLILGQVAFGVGTVAAFICLAGLIYLLVRKNKYEESGVNLRAVAAAE